MQEDALQRSISELISSLDDVTALHTLQQETFGESAPLSLVDLSREHLTQLAKCHSLCAIDMMYSWTPTSILTKWLTVRAQELILDDHLLHTEGEAGIQALSEREVVDACLRRGILSKGVYAKAVLERGVEDEEVRRSIGST